MNYVKNIKIVTSQLGFRIESHKYIKLIPGDFAKDIPEKIKFYIQFVGNRLQRDHKIPKVWNDDVFRWPFDIGKGRINDTEKNNMSWNGKPIYIGMLEKKETSWGILWQSDFTDFQNPGIFQIETEYGFSLPFVIEEYPYERLSRSFLIYLYAQRSGMEVPGVRPLENAHDGILDTDGTYIPAAGGWNDAGDHRKWMALTQVNMEGLFNVFQFGHPTFREKVLDEIRWGNKYFHAMISDDGQVYEDLGGGDLKPGFSYDDGWWQENHPGCLAITDPFLFDGVDTENKRVIRTTYNPVVQYLFIRSQAIISKLPQFEESVKCLKLAEKAWEYAKQINHDQRTLFVCEEVLAAIELYNCKSKKINKEIIEEKIAMVLQRQFHGEGELSGYFLEKDNADGYRSIVYSCEPAMALLRYCELFQNNRDDLYEKVSNAIVEYIDNYLIADSNSNPYKITPYGIYVDPPYSDDQKFRNAGNGRGVRTFIHPFGENTLPHGTNSVIMHQAYLLSRAGKFFKRIDWQKHAEILLSWAFGHNPSGLSLFSGIGFKHPVPASFYNYRIPEACVAGFIGKPDDTPYLEESNGIEWSTQEIWDVPFSYAVSSVMYLKQQ